MRMAFLFSDLCLKVRCWTTTSRKWRKSLKRQLNHSIWQKGGGGRVGIRKRFETVISRMFLFVNSVAWLEWYSYWARSMGKMAKKMIKVKLCVLLTCLIFRVWWGIGIIPLQLDGPRVRNPGRASVSLGDWHSQGLGFYGINNDNHQFQGNWKENVQK